MSRQSRKWMAVTLFAMSLLIFTGGNLQATRIQMTTRLGFGDFVIPGRWVPLKVQITGAVESARVEVSRYNEDESIPSRESFALSNTTAAPGNLEIPVMDDFKTGSLITRLYRGDQPVTQQARDISNKTFPGHLILTINLPAKEQQAIEKSLLPLEPVLAVPIPPEELPSLGLNYDGVSSLVINEPGLILAPAQIKALRSWLAGGGRMVIFTKAQQPVSWLGRLIGDSSVHVKSSRSQQGHEFFPVGFGGFVIIQQEQEANGILRFSGDWRGILNLKPYARTFRLSPSRCFPATYTGKAEPKFNPINPLSIFLFVWIGAGVFIVLIRKKKPSVAHFFIFALLSAVVAVPLGGKLAAAWKHGATWHTRAVILPDGGGTIINTTISLDPTVKWENRVIGSPWGVVIKGVSDESGGIEFNQNGDRKGRTTFWRHQQMASRYSLRAGGSTNLLLTGCFPEFGVDVFGKSTNTPDSMNLKLHQLMIPNETISWDGAQWRLLINNNLNSPLWREISEPPEWFRTDADWMKSFHKSFPETLWLGGRFLLPKDLCLSIQGGPIPEFFWVMPSPSQAITP